MCGEGLVSRVCVVKAWSVECVVEAWSVACVIFIKYTVMHFLLSYLTFSRRIWVDHKNITILMGATSTLLSHPALLLPVAEGRFIVRLP